jgi:hypothetical protein
MEVFDERKMASNNSKIREEIALYPLRLVLGLLPGVAVLAYEGAAPLATARAVCLLSLAIGLLSFLLSVVLDAGLFQ